MFLLKQTLQVFSSLDFFSTCFWTSKLLMQVILPKKYVENKICMQVTYKVCLDHYLVLISMGQLTNAQCFYAHTKNSQRLIQDHSAESCCHCQISIFLVCNESMFKCRERYQRKDRSVFVCNFVNSQELSRELLYACKLFLFT